MFVFVLSHFHFVLMTVIIFISFFWKGMKFRFTLIFRLDNNGRREPMVSLSSLVSSWEFLAIVFDLKSNVGLFRARLHGATYHIWIQFTYRGLKFDKINLFWLIYVSNLFRWVIAAWYEPLLIQLYWWWRSSDCVDCLLGCGPSPWSLSIYSWSFYF